MKAWIVTSQPSGKFLGAFDSEKVALSSIGLSYSRLRVNVEKAPMAMQPGWRVEIQVHTEGQKRTDVVWVQEVNVYSEPEHL